MEKKGINIEQTVDKNGINLETAVMEYDYYADICDCFYELKALYLEQDLQKRQSRSCRREVTEVKKICTGASFGKTFSSDPGGKRKYEREPFFTCFQEGNRNQFLGVRQSAADGQSNGTSDGDRSSDW